MATPPKKSEPSNESALLARIAELEGKLGEETEMRELFEERYNRVHGENLSAELTKRRMQKVIDQQQDAINRMQGTKLPEPGTRADKLMGGASPQALTEQVSLPPERKPPTPPRGERKATAKKPPAPRPTEKEL